MVLRKAFLIAGLSLALSLPASGQVATGPSGPYSNALLGQLPGTATNDSASAGNIGEIISSTVTSGSPVSLSTGAVTNVTSVSLTAGDWDCNAIVGFSGGATTTVSTVQGSISGTTGTLDSLVQTDADFASVTIFNAFSDGLFRLPIGTVRESLAGTTTIFMTAKLAFLVSTANAFGTLRCRRVR